MKLITPHIFYVIGTVLLVSAVGWYGFESYNTALIKASFNDQAATSTVSTSTAVIDPIVPVSIAIPAIDVFTVVEHVGVNDNGNMAVPSGYDTTAWFEPGFKPGENGNAIIAGHVDNSLGLAGVFIDLDQLVIGDTVIVQSEDGTELTFVVTGYEEVDYRTANVDEIYGRSDTPQIRLITCSGAWLADSGSYDKRLIVTAVLQS